MLLWLPLRSLLRNRRRTLLSFAIIGLGTAIAFVVLGYVQDSRALIRETTVAEFGNLQIASTDLWEETTDGYEYLIAPETLASVNALLEEEPRVRSATAQLQFAGLLASGDRSQVVRVTGFVPENPTLASTGEIVAGRALTPSDTAAVLVGRSLADRLGLEPGAVVTLTLTTVDGAFNASPLRIAGIYRFSSEQVELQRLFLPLGYAQQLLNTAGVDRIVVALQSIGDTEPVRDRLQPRLAATAAALEARTWDELSPIFRQLSGLFDLLFGFIALAMAILVFFIILQVLTLAFLERTREIGTARALGTTRRGVLGQLLAEGSWLAVIGSGTGVLVGAALSIGFNAIGVEWRPPGTVEPVVLTIRMGLSTAIGPFLLGVVATVLSSLYPALQMARLPVVDALRVGR
jgi:putative ABC transport system permease protein